LIYAIAPKISAMILAEYNLIWF